MRVSEILAIAAITLCAWAFVINPVARYISVDLPNSIVKGDAR